MTESICPADVDVPYAKHDEMSKGITTTPFEVNGQKLINVEPWVLTKLAEHCIARLSTTAAHPTRYVA